jgi:hypothetical protein
MNVDVLLGKARVSKFSKLVKDFYRIDRVLSDENLLEFYMCHWYFSSSLYMPLHLLEVMLRNILHLVISKYLNESSWLLSVANNYHKDTFVLIGMEPKIISQLRTFLDNRGKKSPKDKINIFIQKIIKARNNFYSSQRKKGLKEKMVEDDLIANLEFGFWTTLISSEYHPLSVRNHFLHDIIFDKTWPSIEQNIRFLVSSLKRIDNIRKVRNKL